LIKKFALASWSEFNEKFGILFRYITTPSHDDRRKDQLGKILAEMGNAGLGVFQDGEILQLYKTNAVSTIESHLKDIGKYKDRYKYAGNIADILRNPDEIWLANSSEQSYSFNYIKFFKNKPIVVIVEVRAGEPIRIKTFYEFSKDETNIRKGILIKKIKSE
jgi:hypothetical protein